MPCACVLPPLVFKALLRDRAILRRRVRTVSRRSAPNGVRRIERAAAREAQACECESATTRVAGWTMESAAPRDGSTAFEKGGKRRGSVRWSGSRRDAMVGAAARESKPARRRQEVALRQTPTEKRDTHAQRFDDESPAQRRPAHTCRRRAQACVHWRRAGSTSTDRSTSVMRRLPVSAIVVSSSLRMISSARVTPRWPPAPSP